MCFACLFLAPVLPRLDFDCTYTIQTAKGDRLIHYFLRRRHYYFYYPRPQLETTGEHAFLFSFNTSRDLFRLNYCLPWPHIYSIDILEKGGRVANFGA
jgi:hypothetical protein